MAFQTLGSQTVFNATSAGTGNFVVASAFSGGHTPEQANVTDGKTYTYYAQSADGSQWESGSGAYSISTHTLARTTIGGNSNGDTNPVNFTAAPIVYVFSSSSSTLEPVIPRGYLSGLTLSTAGSSATFSVASGLAVDSTAADFTQLLASINKTTSGWAAGTGNGALDTSTIANSTWYHAFLIKRPDTKAVDVLISLSATAPTLPANYTLFRRIGSMKTDGSGNWVAFNQNGDEFLWMAPVADASNVNFSNVTLSQTLTVPLGIRVNAIFSALLVSSGATHILFYALDAGTQASSTNNLSLASNAITQVGSIFNVRINTSAQIGVVGDGAGGSFYIGTQGWIDTRGRLA